MLEGKLRRPCEWLSSAALMVAAGMLVGFPQWFLLTPLSADGMASLVIGLAWWRYWQGYQVVSYQRHLRQLPQYVLRPDQLPDSSTGVFLGKGFQWQVKHTQRLRDSKQQLHLTPLNDNPLGGSPALHAVGFNQRLWGHREQSIYLPLSERVGHTLVVGTTRVGKTRLLELPIIADIRRGDGAVVVIDPKGDPELLRCVCSEAIRQDRQADLVIFHLGYPDLSARYNPIGHFTRVTEVANRVANQLPSHGESATFREFGWRFVNIIASAMVALDQQPTYKALDRYLFNIDPLLTAYCERYLADVQPDWKAVVDETLETVKEKSLPLHLKNRSRWMVALIRSIAHWQLDDPILADLTAMFNYDQTYFQKITASLSPLFAKLTSGRVGELISPDEQDLTDPRPVFSWNDVIQHKKLVYMGLDALSDSMVASAVGNSLFADLCSTIGEIYKFGVKGQAKSSDIDDTCDTRDTSDSNNRDNTHRNTATKAHCLPIYVYADEFNELAGDEFVPLVNKGGGAGLRLTVATQTIADVEARLGSRAKADQVLGNFNHWIFLRAVDEATAKRFTDKLPQRVASHALLSSSSSSDPANSDTFSSHNEDRLTLTEEALITADDVMQLPKGHAFCLLSGGILWKLRIPLLQHDHDNSVILPHDVPALLQYLATHRQ